MKIIFLFFTFALLFTACKITDKTVKDATASKMDLFYGQWKVIAFRFLDGRVMPGEYMGNPQYEFTKEGKRIKTLNTEPAPPPEAVDYKIEGDSIKYPNNPKYPAMKIARLIKDTMVLSNDKLSWYLHK
jgi:hypothetical protein